MERRLRCFDDYFVLYIAGFWSCFGGQSWILTGDGMTVGRYVDIDKVEWNKHYLAISNGTVVQETLQVDANYLNKLAEDVAPVVHAHWRTKEFGYAILNMNDEVMWLAGVPCSCCSITGQTNWKYCPNCGAKMDEEVE